MISQRYGLRITLKVGEIWNVCINDFVIFLFIHYSYSCMPKIELLFLVDDDPDDQHVFAEALSEIDTDVNLVTASNGLEALETLKRNHSRLPDLIFLDLNMPKMNGKQFLKEIKSLSPFRDIPVVIYSTSSAKMDMDETLAMGAEGFIVKPDSFGAVCEAIRGVIK